MLRKKSVAAAAEAAAEAAASRGAAQDPKMLSWVDQSLHPISPGPDTAPAPAAPEDRPDDLHYACLNFQGVKPREDCGPTDALTEYSEIKFQ
ncbi:sialic acid-binding Ig-like lectin 12 [Phascolarctos cinereus]|uniref:Sialic acid-binding Ig-like lectin 12 n=1 Tax=Phascolarctos cinereus TaxID=38626 RepID=A0A6P5LS80_PHACI|nr:sialic acid-binding Ig-like lectin 12 [Phascolarctos cinereus]